MAKYTYICSECEIKVQKFTSVDKDTIRCKCGKDMNRQMPKLSGHAQVTETIDKYTNKKLKQDQDEILTERNADYYWSVEVPRLVNSGVYAIDTMLEKGWIYFDDKEQIQVRTKPPEKE